ncbi:cytochrome b561 and DOMON domain-containing protein At3g07570-like [Primulina tabacum]|uniref:cytochrome b561 and DOMON domain-containing protein At3g07570-like n=1 Tax=Primulina tabacum TaxID=48773 RepID=UPI003F59FE97
MMSSPKHSPQLFFLIFLFLFSNVHPQALDSCNSPLSNTLPFDTSSLQCVVVWPSQSFILRYGQVSPNIWSYVLSAPNTNGYIAIGFSPNGNMVGSSAIVGWIGNNGIDSGIKKFYLGGKSPNLVTLQPQDQGLQLQNMFISTLQNQIYMVFQVASNNPSMNIIYAVGPAGQLPSAPNFALSQHRAMYSTVVNYGTGGTVTQSSPEESLKRIHGILNVAGWGILIPIGAMIARYMRHWDPQWFYSHAIIQFTGFTLGAIGVFCGLALENRLDIYVDKHKALGIFVLILGGLQVLAIFVRPHRASKVRKYWNWYHSNVGRLLIVLAIINIFYGIKLGKEGSEWNQGFAIVIVVFFTISLVLELRMWTRK